MIDLWHLVGIYFSQTAPVEHVQCVLGVLWPITISAVPTHTNIGRESTSRRTTVSGIVGCHGEPR